MTKTSSRLAIVAVIALLFAHAAAAIGAVESPSAEEAKAPSADRVKAKARAMMETGITWLLEQQNEDGSFAKQKQMEPAVTALAVRAMATSPPSPSAPTAICRSARPAKPSLTDRSSAPTAHRRAELTGICRMSKMGPDRGV